jgi:hypothetical protein
MERIGTKSGPAASTSPEADVTHNNGSKVEFHPQNGHHLEGL